MGQRFSAEKHLNFVLALVLAFFALVITLGTGIAFISGKAQPGMFLRKAEKPPSEKVGAKTPDGKMLMNFDQIRAVLRMEEDTKKNTTLGGEFTTVILKPWFSYNDDADFDEEIKLKKRKLRQIFPEYFARYSAEELLAKGETDVKRELTALIDAELTMGKITRLYLEEYIFF